MFIESFVESDPDGSVITVSLLDDYQRQSKRAIRERMEGDAAVLGSGVFESGTFGTTAMVKKGVARAFTVTNADLTTTYLQDGRLAVNLDDDTLYHSRASGLTRMKVRSADIIAGTMPTGTIFPDITVTPGAAAFQSLTATTGVFTSGTVTVGASGLSGSALFHLNTAAGNNRYVQYSSAGVVRWQMIVNTEAESGGNAGAPWQLSAYTDAGAFIDAPIRVIRASGGAITLSRPLSVTGTSSLQAVTATTGVFSSTFDSVGLTSLATTNGSVIVGSAGLAGQSQVILRTAAGQSRTFVLATGSSTRWSIRGSSTAETGGDAGTNFALDAYGDTGAFIDSPITINRVGGGITHFTRPVTMGTTLTATGNITSLAGVNATNAIIGGNFVAAGATSSLMWTGRARLNSPADSIVTLFNNAASDFARLQFGGTTAAFPALRRTGATLEVVTADAAAFAGLVALYFTAPTTTAAASAGVVRLTNNATIAWRNQANTDNHTLTLNASDQFVFSAGVAFQALTATTGTFTGAVTAATLRVGPSGTGSIQPLEIVGTDSGLAITSTNTGPAATVESYIAGFLKDASGNYQKVGADAFQWADKNVVDGYGSWNVHTTAFTAGVTNDYYGLAVWAKHGAAFFPANTQAASAPGLDVLKVNGALLITSTATFQGAISSLESIGQSRSSDSVFTTLAARNTSGGVVAVNRVSFGNNVSPLSFTIDVHGGNHATLPNTVAIYNQLGAQMLIGTAGVAAITISATQETAFSAAVTAPTFGGVAMSGNAITALGSVSSGSGSVSVPTATLTNLFAPTLPGMYLVIVRRNDGSTNPGGIFITGGHAGAALAVFEVIDTGANLVLSWNGASIAVTQTSGVTHVLHWSYLRIN